MAMISSVKVLSTEKKGLSEDEYASFLIVDKDSF
jgi:hypothetical protein